MYGKKKNRFYVEDKETSSGLQEEQLSNVDDELGNFGLRKRGVRWSEVRGNDSGAHLGDLGSSEAAGSPYTLNALVTGTTSACPLAVNPYVRNGFLAALTGCLRDGEGT